MYDLTVIGAGWAGFNAALSAKELGLKVALIEGAQIGGTCLNRGCIPTKALIQSAKVYSLAKKSALFGVETSSPQINLLKVQERKDKTIQQLQAGMQFMLKGIDFIKGQARLLSSSQIKVDTQTIDTKAILIATGSKPFEPPFLKFDGKKVLSSDDILNLKEIPGKLLIIGGGVIGCEFASLFSCLGSEVSIAEKMPQLLPGMDKEIANKLQAFFKKKGIQVNIGIDASTLDLGSYELVLLCIGRIAHSSGLDIEPVGIKTEKSRIITDDYLATSIPNIYAAGDCTARIMLAHYAAYQGHLAASNIAGPQNKRSASNTTVPSCIFTDPEMASVGLSQDQAQAQGLDVEISRFDFRASGMARIQEEAEGMIKVIVSKQTRQVLGASIIGPKATELIAVFSLAVSCRMKASDIRETIFAHPTLSESIGEVFKAY